MAISCFNCNGLDSESLLKSGYFQQLLNFDITDVKSDPALKLLGNTTTSASLFNNMRQTFMKIKQKFYLVKDLSTRKCDYFAKESDVEVLRTDILKIFHVFLANLQKLNSSHETFSNISARNNHAKNIVMQLAGEMKHLLICVGRISAIPDINTVSDFSSSTSKRSFNFYHFYHLCLDIWYNCLMMLYIAHISMPVDFRTTFCDFVEHSSAFLQVASFLVYDLSFLSINRFMNHHLHNDSPFICLCVRDFWIMLIKLCDCFSVHNDRQAFWNLYLSNLQIILKKTSQVVEDFPIDKFTVQNMNVISDHHKLTESCFWLTSHIATLYKYNIFGRLDEFEKFSTGSIVDKFKKSNHGSIVGKYLIHNLLSDQEISEKQLRSCLLYCVEFSKMWDSNIEALFLLTDFYIKKIDTPFNAQEISFSYLIKDAKSWFIYVDNLSNIATSNKETSFDYFLTVLCLQLKFDSDNSLWRSLKGRIYSKFMPKKIKEMSEIGLQNTFSLFLAIAVSGQSEIVGKICEIATIIESLSNPRKQLISWKALFVLLYINQAKKQESGKITELLSKCFDLVCSDYSKVSSDSVFKNNLMNLLLVYIDNMGELFTKSDGFSSSTYQLISAGFSVLLKTCGLSDQNYILCVILSILQNIQKITESNEIDYIINNTECIRVLQLIFENIYPFVENIAVTDNGLLVVSDIAVILTKLTFTFASSINSSTFDYYNIFMFFACKENVDSLMACHYLSLMFDHSPIIEEIRHRSIDLDVLILQSWLKCLINIQSKNDNLLELTKKVLCLPIVSELLPSGFEVNFESEDPIEIACFLFNAVENAFTHYSMPEKIKQSRQVQSFFKNYASLAMNKIHKGKNAPTFSHVYKLTSLIIEQCSSVLHFRVSSESILLQILDKIIYPQILFVKDKTLQNLASYAIKEHLPFFLRGLFKLDYHKDKSIEREIRDIFIYYIGVLPVSNNPLIKLFIDSFSETPGALNLDARLFVLETLKSSLLSNNVENPLSIFRFYQEIFLLAPPAYKRDITNIILKCSMEIYMGRKDSTAEFLKGLIKKVLLYFKEKSTLSQSKVVLKPVVMWFIEEKLQWSVIRGFALMDLFVDHVPQVMLDLVEFLKKSIEALEKNRGLGEDKLLRDGFQNFIAKLQLKLTKS